MGSMGAWAELAHLGGQELMAPVVAYSLDDKAMDRDAAEALAATAARALARLDAIEARYGLDRKDGSVITFVRHIGTRTYNYAAIRAGGRWYLTGDRSPQGLAWRELTRWLDSEGVQEITELVEAPADPDSEGDYPARNR